MSKPVKKSRILRQAVAEIRTPSLADYGQLVAGISVLLEQARRAATRAANKFLTPTYWEIGRRIVEHEQEGKARAEYGEALLVDLARDLTARHGRGFSKSNIFQMRAFYLGWEIFQTPSGIFEARAKYPTLSGKSDIRKSQTVSAKSEQALRREILMAQRVIRARRTKGV